ncbi:MAG: insulinase family protein [Candidatus Wallbacteria bacterium]|nr:insulinase family protein [Candidatus Wallbacteria bacterium]
MKFVSGSVYHGFKLLKKKKISEVNSTGLIFEHEKSGARLSALSNSDDNKVFSISFRTPPYNDTGLPHILEHSVLCGSRKFKSKEPFVELIKGSLSTFVNAMTFSDKTMYPVASRNEKDFFNLMDVYLDAVLYPNIHLKPEILMQEGWHYELDTPDSPLSYKGVVYNEMKGAYSSPERILSKEIQKSLFPDNAYGFDSGGDPEAIPTLTLAEFRRFHRTYYHPSNSYIFLYGNGDLDKQLGFINDNYLKDYDRISLDSRISMQKEFGSIEIIREYPVPQSADTAGKAFLSLNWLVGKPLSSEFYIAFDILRSMLLDTPGAPLKEALIKSGLGKDVMGQFEEGLLQNYFSVIVKYSDEHRKDEFRKIVNDTLKKMVKDGIDRELVAACINRKEFELREAEGHGLPKGLHYNFMMMDSWLHEGDPFANLSFSRNFRKIRKALTSDYFEKLIKKYLLSSRHSTLLVMKPEKGLLEKNQAALSAALTQHKETLSRIDLEKLTAETARLKQLQSTPDEAGALETIPLLSLSDIDRKITEIPLTVIDLNSVQVLKHGIFTSGIAYLNLYFDSSVVREEQIPYLGLLSGLLTKISTKSNHYSQLTKKINTHTGGVSFFPESYPERNTDSIYFPKFLVKAKALVAEFPELLKILGEIMLESDFSDGDRLLEVIREIKSRLEMRIPMEGHLYSWRRVRSYYSQYGKYEELVKGISFYQFIADLEKNFEKKSDSLKKILSGIFRTLFSRQALVASITSDESDCGNLIAELSGLCEKLPDTSAAKQNYRFDLTVENEGLMTQSQVQFVAKGYNYRQLGLDYSGNLAVLKTIVGLDHLWNKVRVQGGAYGAHIIVGREGNLSFGSYRDPNLSETLKIYDETGDYLRGFNPDRREMTKYIIGTIGHLDSQITPSAKADASDRNYLCRVTNEDLQRERDEILSTGMEDIRKMAGVFDKLTGKKCLCVLGNESRIEKEGNLFGKKSRVFE